jgi:hypothetical protein
MQAMRRSFRTPSHGNLIIQLSYDRIARMIGNQISYQDSLPIVDMFFCKRCNSILKGNLAPGASVLCAQCGKNNRLPLQPQFSECVFDNFVRSSTGMTASRGELAAAVADARLNGARWRRIKASLESVNPGFQDREEVFDMAKEMIRAGSRTNGRKMFILGLCCILFFTSTTVAQYLFGWGTIYISASLLAVGFVYTIVGMLKWMSGFNIR